LVEKGSDKLFYLFYPDAIYPKSSAPGKSSQTGSARPDGVWAGSQPLILRAKRSGLLTHIAADGRRFIVRADGKLSAFVELERQALTVTFYLESIQ
jgi:hypothetical protein